ncbi:MAG: YihY/virulence factor BrkB family protein [Bacteroidales bacterium]|nr:YihY/virulence factor BrkB family protein [Bacteroidales bacterium]
MIKKIIQFINVEIWRVSLKGMPKIKFILIKILRVILLALRGYKEDKIQQKASALTFYSLMSVVPVFAMGFGIAKGFGLEQSLEKQLIDNFSEQQEVLNWIISFAHSFLDNTKGGMIAGIGIAILFWSVMQVLGNIEKSFNDIWEINKSRVFMRKFSDYLSIMLFAPILMILSSSVTVFVTTQITDLTNEVEFISMFGPFIFFIIKLIPYILIWLLFTIIYMVMPNTKVNFVSALIAGVIAGSIFQLAQWGYIHFQVGVSKYNAIYGSFAAFPLFLIWMQLSWLIVLFGAEISFAYQNIHRYEFESDTENISYSYKRLLYLLISNLVIKNFMHGGKAYTASQISQKLEIPIRLVRQLIYELVNGNIFSETISENHKVNAYQPAQDINKLSVNFIINAIEDYGSKNIRVIKSDEYNSIEKTLNSFKSILNKNNDNVLLKDI